MHDSVAIARRRLRPGALRMGFAATEASAFEPPACTEGMARSAPTWSETDSRLLANTIQRCCVRWGHCLGSTRRNEATLCTLCCRTAQVWAGTMPPAFGDGEILAQDVSSVEWFTLSKTG